MTDHKLVAFYRDNGGRWFARCSCNWRALFQPSERRIERMFENHKELRERKP